MVESAVPLTELQPDSCGVGEWTLRVHGEPRLEQHEYECQGKKRQGAKVEVTLVSIDPEQYCLGMAIRGGQMTDAHLKTWWRSSKLEPFGSLPKSLW